MLSLTFKECRHIGKSLIYFVFILVVLAMYITQYIPSDFLGSIVKPRKITDFNKFYNKYHTYPYGTKAADIPDQIVPAATENLFGEYSQGHYDAYPYIIHQNVRLNKEHTKRIEQALMDITGKSLNTLMKLYEHNKWNSIDFSSAEKNYAHFKKLMSEIDSMLGGGSNYSSTNLIEFGQKPITYKEAVANRSVLVYKDKISNGFARLFSDYTGITMGIFPIFVVIGFLLKDRKSRMKELVYSRRLSSEKLIVARYIALTLMLMLPVLITAAFSTIHCFRIAQKVKLSIDYLAFFKYSLGWILPTVMAVTAIGMFLTLLTETPIALPVQIIWFFFSLSRGGLGGNYGLSQLIIRFNTFGDRQLFISNINTILINRLFYILLSFVFIAASIYILNLKRIGRIDFHAKLSRYFTGFKGKLKNSFSK